MIDGDNDQEETTDELDVSEGFGGFPDDVSLTQSLGCASNQRKKTTLDILKTEDKDLSDPDK